MSNRNIFAAHAHKYGGFGWQIFPLAQGEKVPFRGTSGLKEASADQGRIAAWQKQYPDANIGLLCGPGSGVIVVDIDPRNGGTQTVERHVKAGRVFTPTVESATPSGGRHLFYAYDPKVAVSGANKLGAGVDISTNNHYAVLPPSYWAKADKSYRWVAPPRGTAFTPLPKWVVEALQPRVELKRTPMKRIDFGDMQGYRRQALSDLDYIMRKIAQLQDGRHEAPFKAGVYLGAYVHHGLLSEAEIEQAVLEGCSRNGALARYKADDLRKQLYNGLKRATADELPPLHRAHKYPAKSAA